MLKPLEYLDSSCEETSQLDLQVLGQSSQVCHCLGTCYLSVCYAVQLP